MSCPHGLDSEGVCQTCQDDNVRGLAERLYVSKVNYRPPMSDEEYIAFSHECFRMAQNFMFVSKKRMR